MISPLPWLKVIWAALSSYSNKAFYDRISSIYDAVYVVHRIHAETILKVMNVLHFDQAQETLVLDLGCGTGMLSTLLSEKGYEVIGLDISFPSLCILRQRNPGSIVIQADANILPVADRSFRAVVCLGVWRHFPNIEGVLSEISRILTVDGVFIVGYFPPAIAGIMHVNQNCWGRFVTGLYQMLIPRLGYQDRTDFSLEGDTEEAMGKQFKMVSTISSDFHRYVLLARYPLAQHFTLFTSDVAGPDRQTYIASAGSM